MSFKINHDVKSPLSLEQLRSSILKEKSRYTAAILLCNDIELVFLKTVIFIEELIKFSNKKIHGLDTRVGLDKQIKCFKLISDEDVLDAIHNLQKVKKFRDKIAHDISYHIESDKDFIAIMKIKTEDSIILKKQKIADFFKEIIYSILYIKIGVEKIDNFLIYVCSERD